jgi:heptosyltransferase II
MNVVVFLPNWIGDVTMATPTLRALRTHFAGARLVGVMRPYVAEVLAGTPWLDEQVLYHPGSKDARLRSWSLLGQLRARKPELAVLLPNSLRTGALAWASGARRRIGFVRYGRGSLLTHKLYHPRHGRKYLPTPAIDCYLQLAYAAGCAWESPRLELATLAEDERGADAVWQKLGLPPGERVVTLNSGGAFGAAKQWPAEHFARLAQRLADDDGFSVLVNCGPAEREIARRIVALAGHPRVVSLADEQVPIGLTKACIRRSRLLVTTDSGPRFFAVAFGVPVVSLFGPVHPDWSRTHWAHETCLAESVPCGPCMKRVCPLAHHRCMRDLRVERVHDAVRQLLSATLAGAKAA